MWYEVKQQYHHIINLLKVLMWLPVLGGFPSFILAVAHSHLKAVDFLFVCLFFPQVGYAYLSSTPLLALVDHSQYQPEILVVMAMWQQQQQQTNVGDCVFDCIT